MKNLDVPVKYVSVYPSHIKLVRCPPGWTGNTIPRQNMFFYVLEGGFVLNIENQSYFVQKNQIAFLPQDKQHSFWLLPDENLTILDFAFRSECNGEDLFAFFGCNEDHHVIHLSEKEMMDIYTATSAPSSPIFDTSRRITNCSEITKLCSLYIRARINRENAKEEFSDVIAYMRAHLTDDIPLETLADLMHFDTAYFSAKFKKETGVPPMKYFAQMRAKEAARLLRHTEMPLAAVSAAIGFDNVYYFKKFFEKHMGVRPERYKEIFVAPPSISSHKLTE